jgi:hypothetical protein
MGIGMGGMTGETTGKWVNLSAVLKQFPKVPYRLLGAMGTKLTKELYNNWLLGQKGITYHSRSMIGGIPEDKQGNRLITYRIAKSGKSVKVRSYPLNLFENGRKLRSKRGMPEKREPGRHILRSFRNSIDPQKYAAAAFEYIMRDEFKAAGDSE